MYSNDSDKPSRGEVLPSMPPAGLRPTSPKKKSHRLFYLFLAILTIAAASFLYFSRKETPATQTLTTIRPEVSKEHILGILQSQAQIASTIVVIRKMGIYDSDSDKVSLNPNSWKIGHRLCVVPVDITIKYGIDLNEMTSNDIIYSKDNSTVQIRLPQAKILDRSFTPKTNRAEVLALATGARDNIGETTIQQVKTMAFTDVIEGKDDILFRQLSSEIDKNTKTVFRSVMQGIGLKAEFIK